MTTHTESIIAKQAPSSAFRRLLWVSPLAILAASLANLALYAAAGSLFPVVTTWTGAGPAQIIGANIVYLLMGTIIFAALIRWTARPARNYVLVATAGLLLSLMLPISAAFGFGPPGVPAPGMVVVIVLCLMHVMTYAISVPMFTRLALD